MVDLIDLQLRGREVWDGTVVNVGGGLECSLSLTELTDLCVATTGRTTRLAADSAGERPSDVPVYVSDCRLLEERTAWRPRRDARGIVGDIAGWVRENEDDLKSLITT